VHEKEAAMNNQATMFKTSYYELSGLSKNIDTLQKSVKNIGEMQ